MIGMLSIIERRILDTFGKDNVKIILAPTKSVSGPKHKQNTDGNFLSLPVSQRTMAKL